MWIESDLLNEFETALDALIEFKNKCGEEKRDKNFFAMLQKFSKQTFDFCAYEQMPKLDEILKGMSTVSLLFQTALNTVDYRKDENNVEYKTLWENLKSAWENFFEHFNAYVTTLSQDRSSADLTVIHKDNPGEIEKETFISAKINDISNIPTRPETIGSLGETILKQHPLLSALSAFFTLEGASYLGLTLANQFLGKIITACKEDPYLFGVGITGVGLAFTTATYFAGRKHAKAQQKEVEMNKDEAKKLLYSPV